MSDSRQPEPGSGADETSFRPEPAWEQYVHVRRGGWFCKEVELDQGAAGYWQTVLEQLDPRAEEALGMPESDAAVVAGVRRARAGEADELGAGALAILRVDGLSWNSDERHGTWRLADAWVLRHGLAFAVRAATAAARIDDHRHYGPAAVRLHTGSRTSLHVTMHPLFRRLRSILAAAAEADYEAATLALAANRTQLAARVVASYLVPTRTDWTDELIAEIEGVDPYQFDWEGVLLSLSTPEQVAAVHGDPVNWKFADESVRCTVTDALGPAIAPSLARAIDGDPNGGDSRKEMLRFLAGLPTDPAFGLLVARLGQKHVAPVVAEAMARFPARAVRMLAEAATGRTKTADAAGFLLRGHVRTHPDIVAEALPRLPDEQRAAVEKAMSDADRLPEAPLAALPRVLATPPWTKKRAAGKPTVLSGLEAHAEPKLLWEPGEEARWAGDLRPGGRTDWSKEIAAYEAGRRHMWSEWRLFVNGPTAWVAENLPHWRPTDVWSAESWGRLLLGRHGLLAYRPIVAVATAHPGHGELLLPLSSPEIAELVADWFVRLKSARSVASAWLGRHPDDAARYLVPPALGPAGARRRAAEAALRQLARQGNGEVVAQAAAGHGPEAAEAIGRLLATDPLEVLPARIPVPGAWANPVTLPQIRLREDGHALPDAAAGHVITMLALCRPDETYAGVPYVRETCDPRSLAEFAWALFRGWEGAGFPAKDGWVLTALALLGDDAVVRELSPLIRACPGEGGHARATAALDVLAGIGTDLALTHLNSIAQKVKFKALKVKAQEKITAVADALGLSADQLADRLVPTLGLDEAATAVIDYGPRRFVVGFDEQLKPYVTDQDGKPRKALPKPGAKDDAELAEAEYKRFAALKKDVRTVAADQIARLEAAMVLSRRWPVAEFEQLLAGHPLLWHIVRRLVWRTTAGETFRCAEDRTYANAEDDVYVLPPGAEVGIAHPLELGAELATWSEVFADYEILQPFAQLGRPVAELDDAERAATTLKRFEGLKVPVGKVLGLTKRGWVRGEPQDAGVECWILRPTPGGAAVVVDLSPGIAAGDVSWEPEQELGKIWLDEARGSHWRSGEGRRFGELDPVTASELLGELNGLTR
ncbi:DUF4132 domain-containing protein [Amycolatopsis sp. CA-161197]|uniref:DUF4132 domain-containing protein n=1 Tax=Amycolatopsis sp. CA-161197 TaxID=3239922 RepID=UPI003D91A472